MPFANNSLGNCVRRAMLCPMTGAALREMMQFVLAKVAVAGLITMSAGALVACEEATPPAPRVEPKPAPEPPPEPPPKSPPSLSVDEGGPQVRGLGVVLTQPNGAPDAVGRQKLQTYLEDEREFLADKELSVSVVRKAKTNYVAIFLEELAKFSPSKISITTETRGDLPGTVPFVAQSKVADAKECTLIGTITEDRGTAIWRLSGGAARKRGRGMGGPDLTLTGETIASMAKDCESDVFFVTGVEGVEWGLVYDLAAAGISLEKAGLTRAVVPTSEATAGNPYAL